MIHKSERFTALAKKYNPNIDYVEFSWLEENLFGIAARSSSHREKYRILIDRKKTYCPVHLFFVFFHEVGHIVLDHLGYKYHAKNCSKEGKEAEADSWAFKELGIMDSQGKINEGYRICYGHITGQGKGCEKWKRKI